MNETERKAKRRLSNFNFDVSGSHCAFVGPSVGGAANGYTVLVTKSVNDIPEEIVEKATQVAVTMDFEEFLVKWFNMYYSDAEVLAKLLGMEKEEQPSDMYDYQGEHRKWLEEKVAAIQIMKSLHASQDVKKAFNELSYKESLDVIEAQSTLESVLEKAMSSAVEGKNVPVTKGQEKPTNEEENPMENLMEDVIQKALHVELVEKAVQEAVEKAAAEKAAVEDVLKAAQAELEGVKAEVAVFKAKEAEAIVKSRKDALQAVLAEDQVEDMFKATEALDAAAFDFVVKSLAAKAKALEESDLFKEAGVSGEGENDPAVKDGTAAILKAKYQRKG